MRNASYKTHSTLLLAALISMTAGCQREPATPPPPSEQRPTQFEIDKQAFLSARKAAAAFTWHAADQVLGMIDQEKIDDVEVVDFVGLSFRSVKLAMKLGIDRYADPNSTESVLSSLNVLKVAAILVKAAQEQDPSQVLNLLADAPQIQKELANYSDLYSKLAARYGTG
jgi:hypothetical protein